MKKLLNLLACLALAAHLNACTSNDSRDESEDGSIAEDSLETGGADASLEEEGGSTDNVAENNDGFLDEQLPEDALGESTPEQEVAKAEPPPVVEETPATADSTIVTSEPPVTETPSPVIEEPAKDSFAAVDTGTSEPTTSDLGAVASTTSTEMASEEKPKSAPLRKIESAPFRRAGVLANAVYVARPGDSFASISKSIYGDESKTKELKKVNPYFSKVRPGDKVYYNSPVRPTDDTKLLTRYEDSGLIPETYVAKEGDDIKELGKQLLGYDNGWKELWTTNSVDSKGTLTAGTELRYWKTAPAAALPPSMPIEQAPPPQMANNFPPPAESFPPPPVAQNDIPAPPEMNMAPPPPAPTMDMPAEPVPPPQSQQDLPPPPPAEAVNPPPPPVAVKKPAPVSENIGGLDNDMIMTLGGAGILLAAIALMVIVRRRRQQKEMSAAFGDTHVGT